MTGFTNRVSAGVVDHVTGKTAIFAVTTPVFVCLFTAVGTDAGTGFTEVTGGSYARVARAATDWNAATGTAPSSASTATATTFPASTGAWSSGANIIAFGIYDASTAGNLLAWDYLGSDVWKPFSATLASPSVFTAPAHGFTAGASVVVTAEFGGTLPTGGTFTGLLTVGASPTTDTFNVGVNATASGSGMVRSVTPLVVGSAGITPSVASGSLVLASA
jgi:hypothetical protein